MSEWKMRTIAEIAAQEKNALATGPFGSAIGSRFFRDAGVPVIRGSNLSLDVGQRLNEKDLVFIEEDKAAEFGRSIAVRGDLIFTCWGTIGQVGLIDMRSKYSRYVVSNKQMKLTPDTTVADSLFLYYALSSPMAVAQIQGMSIGSSVPGFNLSQLRGVSLLLPPLPEQLAISAVLGALDDKIAVNERIADAARDLGMALFRRAVQTHNPNGNELGVLAELVSRGVAPKYSEDESELLVLNQKCVRGGRVTLAPARRTCAAKVPTIKRLRKNDVLVNSTGVGTLGRVAIWAGAQEATVDSHITIVRFDASKVDPLCAGFGMLAAQTEIERLGEGSTGQIELSRTTLASLQLLMPSREVQNSLSRQLGELELRGEAALAESQSLAEMRDALLPGLMSGAIRVRDAEKAVEEAT